jgi:hypothetical protein
MIDNTGPERTENLALTVALALVFVISVVLIMLILIGHVRAEPVTVFRNDKGQVIGYGEKRGNTTTYSNEKGQQTGRADRSKDGTIRFYDEKGRNVGSARK